MPLTAPPHSTPSQLPSSVEHIRAALPGVIKRYGIKSMTDSSCGSMLWMPSVLQEVEKDQPGFKFHGSDVVCSLIEKHQKTFVDKPNWSFSCIDYGARGGRRTRGKAAARWAGRSCEAVRGSSAAGCGGTRWRARAIATQFGRRS